MRRISSILRARSYQDLSATYATGLIKHLQHGVVAKKNVTSSSHNGNPLRLLTSDVDNDGEEGEIEIRVCQGGKMGDAVVGETSIELRKLPPDGFERKP